MSVSPGFRRAPSSAAYPRTRTVSPARNLSIRPSARTHTLPVTPVRAAPRPDQRARTERKPRHLPPERIRREPTHLPRLDPHVPADHPLDHYKLRLGLEIPLDMFR